MIREQDMEDINSGDESDHDLISTEMLEDIRDGSQTHPNVNRIEARYKIRYSIRQRKSEWEVELKATQIIVTCLEFTSQIGFDRKVSCLTYFYLTSFPTAKSVFQTRFENCSRYSHTPPKNSVIVNRERINNLLRNIYVGSNWNPNTITNP